METQYWTKERRWSIWRTQAKKLGDKLALQFEQLQDVVFARMVKKWATADIGNNGQNP
jgi:hypothetical protein